MIDYSKYRVVESIPTVRRFFHEIHKQRCLFSVRSLLIPELLQGGQLREELRLSQPLAVKHDRVGHLVFVPVAKKIMTMRDLGSSLTEVRGVGVVGNLLIVVWQFVILQPACRKPRLATPMPGK